MASYVIVITFKVHSFFKCIFAHSFLLETGAIQEWSHVIWYEIWHGYQINAWTVKIQRKSNTGNKITVSLHITRFWGMIDLGETEETD